MGSHFEIRKAQNARKACGHTKFLSPRRLPSSSLANWCAIIHFRRECLAPRLWESHHSCSPTRFLVLRRKQLQQHVRMLELILISCFRSHALWMLYNVRARSQRSNLSAKVRKAGSKERADVNLARQMVHLLKVAFVRD